MDNVVSINSKQSEPHQDQEYTVLVKFGVDKIQQLSSFGIFDTVEQAMAFVNEFPLIQQPNYICEIVPLNRIEINNH